MSSYIVMCSEITGEPVAITYIDPDTNALMYSYLDGSAPSEEPPASSKRCCECTSLLEGDSEASDSGVL